MKLLLAQKELLRRVDDAVPGSQTNLSDGNVAAWATRGIQAFLLIIGAVAVIMLIVGALRYVLSGGDPRATQGAKDTILYALVGIVVALAAVAVVNFVLARL